MALRARKTRWMSLTAPFLVFSDLPELSLSFRVIAISTSLD